MPSSSSPTNPANAAKPESISQIFGGECLLIWRSMLSWETENVAAAGAVHTNRMGIKSATQRSATHADE
jgi:hypothetical protein